MKITFFIILLFTLQSALSYAQDPGNEIRVQINHIAIAVTDLEESETFYRDVIGLKQIPEPFGLGMHAWFDVGGGAQLHVIRASEKRTEQNIYNHLCFSVSDLDSFIENLTSFQIEYSDFAGNVGERTHRPDGIQQIYFTDPDGYWIEINDDM
jgi:lactoylglutathione lyase